MKWCRQVEEIPYEHHWRWWDKQDQDESIQMYSIYADGGIVGVCGLTSIDRVNSRAEFSLYISPTYQGHGYAKEALKLLLEKGFYTHNLNSIWGEMIDGNMAEKLFLSVGMKHEGTRRSFYYKDGVYRDAHLYSIMREEYDLLKCNDSSKYLVPPGPYVESVSDGELLTEGEWRSSCDEETGSSFWTRYYDQKGEPEDK